MFLVYSLLCSDLFVYFLWHTFCSALIRSNYDALGCSVLSKMKCCTTWFTALFFWAYRYEVKNTLFLVSFVKMFGVFEVIFQSDIQVFVYCCVGRLERIVQVCPSQWTELSYLFIYEYIYHQYKWILYIIHTKMYSDIRKTSFKVWFFIHSYFQRPRFTSGMFRKSIRNNNSMSKYLKCLCRKLATASEFG